MTPEYTIQLNILASQRNTAMDNLVVVTAKLVQAEEEIKALKAKLAKTETSDKSVKK